jgi:hypothetical protein
MHIGTEAIRNKEKRQLGDPGTDGRKVLKS